MEISDTFSPCVGEGVRLATSYPPHNKRHKISYEITTTLP